MSLIPLIKKFAQSIKNVRNKTLENGIITDAKVILILGCNSDL